MNIEINIEALRKNRFIFKLPEELGIYYWMVKSIKKSKHYLNMENERKLYVTISECCGFGDIDAIKYCEKFNALNLDEVTYCDLDSTGLELTEEHYRNPRILDISFSGSDYEDDSIKTFNITIKYDSCYLKEK